MASDWRQRKVSEVCTGLFDGPHATPAESDTGPIFLRIENIERSGRLNFSAIRRINEADFPRWTRRVKPQEDDIVFSYEANLGLFCRVPAGFHGCLGRRLALVRPDKTRVVPAYLLYAFLSPTFQELLRQRTVLGSTVDRISLKEFPSYEIPLPPLAEQRAIANILGVLDDKIELNRRMNETLEGLARAIFQSWFVDFDPVRAQRDGLPPPALSPATAALFPDSFEDSDLGKIPTGWKVCRLPDAIEVDPKRQLSKGRVAPYLDMKNMPMRGHRADEIIDREFSSGTKFMNGDTLLARITPCLENGKTAFVDFLNDGDVAWGSTEFIVMRPKEPLPVEFGYFLARSDELRAHAIQNMTGSSGRQRVPASCFERFLLTVPSPEVAAEFGRRVTPSMAKIKANSEQSSRLAAIRDALLPKLLSGEIRVAEAERLVEETT